MRCSLRHDQAFLSGHPQISVGRLNLLSQSVHLSGLVSRVVCVCVCMCTWRLEVDAPHLHGVGGVVWHDVSVVQQAFGAWLCLLTFTAWGWEHRETHEDTT